MPKPFGKLIMENHFEQAKHCVSHQAKWAMVSMATLDSQRANGFIYHLGIGHLVDYFLQLGIQHHPEENVDEFAFVLICFFCWDIYV